MAWRIEQCVVRGEVDNRVRGRVTGRIWLAGRDHPLELALDGNPWRDLAGRVLRFTRRHPATGDLAGLVDRQQGTVGDMTASRKVKIPGGDMDQFGVVDGMGTPPSWRWANALYLEWFSDANGRVVIESADYDLEVDGPSAWDMSPAEEQAQLEANHSAATAFLQRLGDTLDSSHLGDVGYDIDEDRPTTAAEAEADAEQARMDLLLDRIQARMEREKAKPEAFDDIYWEERERLRRERGEPEPKPLTPEQEAEHAAWIDEMNAIADQAMVEYAETGGGPDPEKHPLVIACSDLAFQLYRDTRDHDWTPESATQEHPIWEIVNGVQIASAKLAGALGMRLDGEWPPDSLIAGDVLVRLKKARACLRDALAGLDAADEQRLANPDWRSRTRVQAKTLLAQVQHLIDEVRASLERETE